MNATQTTREALRGLDPVGEGQRHASLTLFPLFGEAPGEASYLPLSQALRENLVEVTEVSESGHVPELRAHNHADRPVFMLDGEELVGAKQNRVINASILLPPESSIVIPVSCVEAGRWSWRSSRSSQGSRSFYAAGRTLYARARVRKAAKVSYSLAAGGRYRGDQIEVWDDISSKASRLRVATRTSAMSDVFDSYAEDLEAYTKAFAPEPRQLGAVFAIGEQVIGAELFCDTDLLAAYLPSIVRGYALDAIEAEDVEAAPSREDAAALIGDLAAAAWAEYAAVGLGEHIRIDAPGLAGGALAHDGSVVHLAGFRFDPPSKWK